jgi:hypothetical protein
VTSAVTVPWQSVWDYSNTFLSPTITKKLTKTRRYSRSALNKSDSPYLTYRLCIRRPSRLSGVWVSNMQCKAARIWWVGKVLIKTRVSQSTTPSKPPIVSFWLNQRQNENTYWSMLKLRLMGFEYGGALCSVATRRLVMRSTQSNGRCCGYRAIGVPVLCI